MEKEIVELGFPLKKNLIFYHDMLQQHGLELVFACVTHDIYYSKDTNFDRLTENQIKRACVRLRTCNVMGEKSLSDDKEMQKQEQELMSQGYQKVFDTIKLDFHYHKEGMASRVQLQDIKDIGLLVYYDNEKYYEFPAEKQRQLLIEDLNSFGFNVRQTDLGIDKLRTLYFGKKMYSKNQNK